MLGCGLSNTIKVLGLTVLMFGCSDSSRMPPITPSTPTPAPSPAPAPGPFADKVLTGVLFEMTSAGRTPVAGVNIELLTCGTSNCPTALTADHLVRTDDDGRYRIEGVYNGELNYLWVLSAVYKVAAPPAPGTCPDACDRVVTVNGDTQLDIELVRR